MENYNPILTIFDASSSAQQTAAGHFPLMNIHPDAQLLDDDFQDDHSKSNNGYMEMVKAGLENSTSNITSTVSEGNYIDLVVGSENEVKPSKKKGEKKSKKPKYAFQTRSQVDILDDGYRWRKYGQKAVKNNKFPRSYYRCTHEGCNVKKQIQRLSKDEGVVVTTYDGMHSHPIHKSTDNFQHILSQMQIYTERGDMQNI